MKSGALMQQANAILQQVMLNMEHERTEYLNAVRATEKRIVEAIGNTTPPMIEENNTDYNKKAPAANSIASDPIMVEVLKLLKSIKDDNNSKNSDNNNSQKRSNNNNNTNRNQRRRKNNNNNNNDKENDPPSTNGNCNGDRNGDRNKDRFSHLGMTGADGNYIRFDTSKYCWSHGACNHDGKNCKKQKEGHKDTATFTNQMNGNTDFCQST